MNKKTQRAQMKQLTVQTYRKALSKHQYTCYNSSGSSKPKQCMMSQYSGYRARSLSRLNNTHLAYSRHTVLTYHTISKHMKYTYKYNTIDKYTSINISKHKYIDNFIHNWPMMGITALRSHRSKENSQSVARIRFIRHRVHSKIQ